MERTWRKPGFSGEVLLLLFISIYSDVFTGVSEVNRYDYCSTLAFSPVFCLCLLRSFVRDIVFIELLLHGDCLEKNAGDFQSVITIRGDGFSGWGITIRGDGFSGFNGPSALVLLHSPSA